MWFTIGVFTLVQIPQRVWLSIEFETSLRRLAQLPMPHLCTSVCRSVLSRCQECIEAESLQFEHMSWLTSLLQHLQNFINTIRSVIFD